MEKELLAFVGIGLPFHRTTSDNIVVPPTSLIFLLFFLLSAWQVNTLYILTSRVPGGWLQREIDFIASKKAGSSLFIIVSCFVHRTVYMFCCIHGPLCLLFKSHCIFKHEAEKNILNLYGNEADFLGFFSEIGSSCVLYTTFWAVPILASNSRNWKTTRRLGKSGSCRLSNSASRGVANSLTRRVWESLTCQVGESESRLSNV